MEQRSSSATAEVTCYIERSKVRQILLVQWPGNLAELLLREVDALPIFAAADFRAPAQRQPDPAGDIPERETWWLIEREGTGLYACSGGNYPDWSPDPWRAHRFETARQADNARLCLASDSLRDGSIVTEHIFINKMPVRGGDV